MFLTITMKRSIHWGKWRPCPEFTSKGNVINIRLLISLPYWNPNDILHKLWILASLTRPPNPRCNMNLELLKLSQNFTFDFLLFLQWNSSGYSWHTIMVIWWVLCDKFLLTKWKRTFDKIQPKSVKIIRQEVEVVI